MQETKGKKNKWLFKKLYVITFVLFSYLCTGCSTEFVFREQKNGVDICSFQTDKGGILLGKINGFHEDHTQRGFLNGLAFLNNSFSRLKVNDTFVFENEDQTEKLVLVVGINNIPLEQWKLTLTKSDPSYVTAIKEYDGKKYLYALHKTVGPEDTFYLEFFVANEEFCACFFTDVGISAVDYESKGKEYWESTAKIMKSKIDLYEKQVEVFRMLNEKEFAKYIDGKGPHYSWTDISLYALSFPFRLTGAVCTSVTGGLGSFFTLLCWGRSRNFAIKGSRNAFLWTIDSTAWWFGIDSYNLELYGRDYSIMRALANGAIL